MLPLPVVLLLAVGIPAMAYVGVCNDCEKLGRSIAALELEQAELLAQRSVQEAKWAEATTVDGLLRTLQRFHLTMRLPQPGQVVQLRGRFYDGWVLENPERRAYARVASPAHE
jgi:hypothetical protein